MKMSLKILPIVLIVIVMMLSACTRKTNPTGNNWSDIVPITFEDSLFTLGFSFADTARVSGYEAGLLAGQVDGAEAIALMRFSGMPSVENLAVVTEAKLSLSLKRRSEEPRDPLTLRFKRLNWGWRADSTEVVADSSMIEVGIADYVVPVVPAGTDSTFTVDLPNDLIQNWYHEGSLGISFAISTEDEGFVELYSIDSGLKGPQLSFKYRLDTDAATADLREFSSYAISDSYRIQAPMGQTLANRWLLQNINPSRIYTRFELNPSRFVDMDGVALSEEQLKHVTINKAELVLYVKDNPYYGATNLYSMRAFNVVRDSIDSPGYLSASDYELLALTGISSGMITRDSVVVNITPLVQGYISGDKDNNGVVIRSLQEMQNFGILELWHFADAPEGKKPFIRVRYSPPFL